MSLEKNENKNLEMKYKDNIKQDFISDCVE